MKGLNIEKATLFAAIIGLFSSGVLSECNRRANIELEEKKAEYTLFIQAIQANNKRGTLDNLKFLLKMGALSKEREEVITKLTDSLYLNSSNQIFTKSDTVSFIDFQIKNGEIDKGDFYQYIRGANIQIMSLDTITKFQLSQYTDNNGEAEICFPRAYGGNFVKISVQKNGYKSKSYEMLLPKNNPGKLQNIVLERK